MLWSFVLVPALLLLVPAAVAHAQNCENFHAVIQAELFPDSVLREGDVWGGNVYAYLGSQVLIGRYSGNNGDTTSHGMANSGVGSDAFDFGDGNTFVATAAHSSFPTPPGWWPDMNGGSYRAADKLYSGTGIFEAASGRLAVSGPWLVWVADTGVLRGRWNGEVTGKICGLR